MTPEELDEIERDFEARASAVGYRDPGQERLRSRSTIGIHTANVERLIAALHEAWAELDMFRKQGRSLRGERASFEAGQAAERDRCAKLAEAFAQEERAMAMEEGNMFAAGGAGAAMTVAHRIRAHGEDSP